VSQNFLAMTGGAVDPVKFLSSSLITIPQPSDNCVNNTYVPLFSLDHWHNYATISGGDMLSASCGAAGRSSRPEGRRVVMGFFGEGQLVPSPAKGSGRALQAPLQIHFYAIFGLEMVSGGDNSEFLTFEKCHQHFQSGGDTSPPSHTKLRLWPRYSTIM